MIAGQYHSPQAKRYPLTMLRRISPKCAILESQQVAQPSAAEIYQINFSSCFGVDSKKQSSWLESFSEEFQAHIDSGKPPAQTFSRVKAVQLGSDSLDESVGSLAIFWTEYL